MKRKKSARRKKPKSWYGRYLISRHWLSFRKRALAYYGNKCGRCKASKKRGIILQVHHLHYLTVGHESLNDVRVLCRGCHKEEHGIR